MPTEILALFLSLSCRYLYLLRADIDKVYPFDLALLRHACCFALVRGWLSSYFSNVEDAALSLDAAFSPLLLRVVVRMITRTHCKILQFLLQRDDLQTHVDCRYAQLINISKMNAVSPHIGCFPAPYTYKVRNCLQHKNRNRASETKILKLSLVRITQVFQRD